jgi:uncharacterized membrane protein
MDTGAVVAAWLHALGVVVVLGYYGILGRIVLPTLKRSLDSETMARTIFALERRALPVVVLGVLLFTVTGVVLLAGDERYAGPGNLFANTWTTLLTVKHVVIIAMLVLGVAIDRLAAGIADTATDEARLRGVGMLELAADGMTGMGAIVLLLTAVAQAS